MHGRQLQTQVANLSGACLVRHPVHILKTAPRTSEPPMPVSFSPTRCHVNLAAIKRNFQRLGAPGARLMPPVIKSRCIRPRALPVAGILDEAGARSFAIGGASEGELRNAGFGQRLLLLTGCRTPDDWEAAALYGLLPLVNDFKNLKWPRPVPIILK